MWKAKTIGRDHSVFLLIKLLHKLEVLNWKDLYLSVAKLQRYSERVKDASKSP